MVFWFGMLYIYIVPFYFIIGIITTHDGTEKRSQGLVSIIPVCVYVCVWGGGVKKEKKNQSQNHTLVARRSKEPEGVRTADNPCTLPPSPRNKSHTLIWCAKPSMVQLDTERWIEEVSESVQQDKQLVTSIGTQRCIYVIQIFNGTIVNNNFSLYILHKKKTKKKNR